MNPIITEAKGDITLQSLIHAINSNKFANPYNVDLLDRWQIRSWLNQL
jgi:hypothetical protein